MKPSEHLEWKHGSTVKSDSSDRICRHDIKCGTERDIVLKTRERSVTDLTRCCSTVADQQNAIIQQICWNREDNTSGGLRRRAILDLHGLPFVCCFLSSFFSFLRFTVSFSQKRGFPLKAGRWFSRNSGFQDVAVLPQIWVWGSFCFLLLSSG